MLVSLQTLKRHTFIKKYHEEHVSLSLLIQPTVSITLRAVSKWFRE